MTPLQRCRSAQCDAPECRSRRTSPSSRRDTRSRRQVVPPLFRFPEGEVMRLARSERRVVALAVLAALAAPLAPRSGRLAAQAAPLGTVTGTIRSAESHEPLPAVTLTISGTQLGAITGPDGRFT